ncbi:MULTISPECIES: DUF2797 domain-containing protein [Streptomyces]|uniref:DUF2797 domain-containing protein n=1 Tax=Streptomyces viridochromogenes TaxID=1938 RepID=A0A0L8JJ50_STRVR|nr:MULTISPECIES: DUF2797 domain-containing protein [Streptomyces]KOG13655.1 hypothetical protein ADK34_30270 [Streptomyces viridochromogenes]
MSWETRRAGGVEWWSRGIGWGGGVPGLRWRGGRVSALTYGQGLAFRAVGVRRCPGARGNPCPLEAAVSGRATGGRCPECARLDRAHSVAADTVADDPQPYRVYLAWFGPGMTKVGITAEARGEARLLEQGAVAFGWLGRGPLMAARRTEEVLRQALGVPDRVAYERKRAARHALPPAGDRAREVEELYGRARAVGGWTETLEPLEFAARDHAEVFGLDGLPRLDGTVTELVGGGVVTGRLLAAAGPDLHLLAPDGRCLVLDTRLMGGWILEAAGEGDGFSVPVTAAAPAAVSAQEGLF